MALALALALALAVALAVALASASCASVLLRDDAENAKKWHPIKTRETEMEEAVHYFISVKEMFDELPTAGLTSSNNKIHAFLGKFSHEYERLVAYVVGHNDKISDLIAMISNQGHHDQQPRGHPEGA